MEDQKDRCPNFALVYGMKRVSSLIITKWGLSFLSYNNFGHLGFVLEIMPSCGQQVAFCQYNDRRSDLSFLPISLSRSQREREREILTGAIRP